MSALGAVLSINNGSDFSYVLRSLHSACILSWCRDPLELQSRTNSRKAWRGLAQFTPPFPSSREPLPGSSPENGGLRVDPAFHVIHIPWDGGTIPVNLCTLAYCESHCCLHAHKPGAAGALSFIVDGYITQTWRSLFPLTSSDMPVLPVYSPWYLPRQTPPTAGSTGIERDVENVDGGSWKRFGGSPYLTEWWCQSTVPNQNITVSPCPAYMNQPVGCGRSTES
jgi:hypothetical protein